MRVDEDMNQSKEVNALYFKRMILDTILQFVIAGVIGIVLAIVGGVLGYFIFGTGAILFKTLLLIIPLVLGLLASFEAVFRHIKAWQSHRTLPDPTATYLGEDVVEITFDVSRSSDGTHQLRMTRIDGPEHYHAEILDPKTSLILESNVCGAIKSKPLNKGESRWLTILNNPEINFIVSHYLGSPPELSGQAYSRILLPKPRILIIEEIGTDVFLFRFTEAGDYAGDTWHQSIEEAKKQAKFEYDIAEDAWKPIPDEVKDVVDFATNI